MSITWRKGDPVPKDWPKWLRDAHIDWCEVEVSSSNVVIWYNGVWQGGTWREGTWRAGTWLNGIWLQGYWREGIWHEGRWEDGTWQGGIWHNGVWSKGLWVGGTWKGGLQKRPRFGWMLSGNGCIAGLDPSGASYRVLSAEDWEPLLKHMDPQKVAEYRALLYWRDLMEKSQEHQGPRTSLFEVLQDDDEV